MSSPVYSIVLFFGGLADMRASAFPNFAFSTTLRSIGDLTGSNKRRLIRGVNVLYAAGKVGILPAALLQIPADMLK